MSDQRSQIDSLFFKQIEEAQSRLEDPDLKDSGDVYRQLEKIHTEGKALIASNRDLCSSIKAAYGRLIGMLDKKDPLRSEIQEKLKALSETLRALSEAERQLQTAPENNPRQLDERLFDETIISLEDKDAFVQCFNKLPTEDQLVYQERLSKAIFGNKDEASIVTALRGTTFEMSRRVQVKEQGLEEVLDHKLPMVTVSYNAYGNKETDFALAPSKEVKEKQIQLDVPIIRDGKPYIYETKSYPRKRYGADGMETNSRNQALSYQKAIENGSVAGATIELRGRLSLEFLFWAMGEGLADNGRVPGVEIIYTFDLPSGNEYRFVLKQAQGRRGLRFRNEFHYSPGSEGDVLRKQDYDIVAGIQASIADKSIARLISDTGTLIDPPSASDDLRPFLTDPSSITSKKVFEEYDRLRNEAIVTRLIEKRNDLRINKDNRKSATSEFATEEYVRSTIQSLQDELAQNPEKAKVKAGYILTPDKIDAVVEKTMAAITSIAAFERRREYDPAEIDNKRERARLGYRGRPEGVALDIDHIILDAIKDVNKEGVDAGKIRDRRVKEFFFKNPDDDKVFFKDEFATEDVLIASDVYQKLKKGDQETTLRLYRESQFSRSYDKPERFQRIEDLPQYLASQDRRYLEIRISDPETGVVTKLANTTEEEIRKQEAQLVKENCTRAERYVGTLPEKRKQQEKKIRGYLKAAIENFEKERDSAIKAENDAAKTGGRKPDFEKIKALSREYQDKIREQYQKLWDVYGKMLRADERGQFEKVIRERIDQNVIKFIYAVTAEGDVIMQEEVLRGLVAGRAAHSELGRGRNIYGAGEIAFTKNQQGMWEITEINNGSGHYRPDSSQTLMYVQNLVEQKNIPVSDQARTEKRLLVDSILRGMPLREADLF